MIASHNSYTYIPATNSAIEAVSKLWRCQKESIQTQYKLGVRYFDIRLCQEGDYWRPCHGMAEMQLVFTSLITLLNQYKTRFKDSILRLVLEKGDESKFRSEISKLDHGKYPNLVMAIIKNNWEIIYKSENHPIIMDYSYEGWNLKNIGNILFSSPIKNWAKKHNPTITQDMIDDKSIVYFMDYVFNK